MFDTFIVCLLMNVYLYISEIEAIEVVLYIDLFSVACIVNKCHYTLSAYRIVTET